MNRVTPRLAVSLMVMGAMPAVAQVSEAALAGVVRDIHGTPQLGALVELLAPDATTIARAFTDDHGHYLFGAVLPGTYQLRASAAFLTPVLRADVRLRTGAHVVADLTMTAMFEAGSWLPTERRTSSAPADDWRWTLRSTANRPLLRLVGDPSSDGTRQSSSSAEHAKTTLEGGQVTFLTGDGNFAEGGNRQIVTLGRAVAGGDTSILKADLGDGTMGGGGSMVVGVGLERARPWGGGTRLFASFASHPELQTGGAAGVQVMHTAATETVAFGDAVLVDAGTLFTAERILSTRMSSAPFLRVAFKPTSEMVLEYRLATSRALQRSDDLDGASVYDQLLTGPDGRPVLSKGLHQEIAFERGNERRRVAVAVYRDSGTMQEIQGGGDLSQSNLGTLPVLYDPLTDTLQLAAKGSTTMGMHMAWTETITAAVSASLEGQVGSAMSLDAPGGRLQEISTQLHARPAAAISGRVQMRSRRTGTTLDAGYRWQPVNTLTQVDEYDVSPGEAYLNLRFRQKLWVGRRLKGLNAVAEATNLLSQGYEPVLGPDEQTLYLAQAPRALQAGLAFTF